MQCQSFRQYTGLASYIAGQLFATAMEKGSVFSPHGCENPHEWKPGCEATTRINLLCSDNQLECVRVRSQSASYLKDKRYQIAIIIVLSQHAGNSSHSPSVVALPSCTYSEKIVTELRAFCSHQTDILQTNYR